MHGMKPWPWVDSIQLAGSRHMFCVCVRRGRAGRARWTYDASWYSARELEDRHGAPCQALENVYLESWSTHSRRRAARCHLVIPASYYEERA